MTEEDYKNWKPLSIQELVELLNDFKYNWWLAGGYSIELFVGKQIRSHGDIDILIKREDQIKIQEYLSSWELYRSTYPGLQIWKKNEFLTDRYRDIWCRPHSNSPWRLQIMLFDTEKDEWIFKRDLNIRGELKSMHRNSNNLKYLSPEIQLLYKAKEETLDKDQIDFNETLPLLDNKSKKWLLNNLRIRFPNGHIWINKIEDVQ